jgi:uncharacterized protein (DUF2141 family)
MHIRTLLPLSVFAATFIFATATPCAAPQQSGAESSPSGCTLRVHVDRFRNTKGNLGTVVFKSPDGWPENIAKAFRAGPAAIDKTNRTATAVWVHLPPGKYAIAAIHDENSNAKLDRGRFGVPKEGVGFANNPHIWLSAPAFSKAAIYVGCPTTDVTIHLQYK